MKVELSTIANLCKRRGFIFQSSEIYGGINGFWDYGPYGVALKKAVENLWWQFMVVDRENVIGQDSTIICHPRVWDASGHTSQFSDIMIDNKVNKKRYRLDNLLASQNKDTLELLANDFMCENTIDALEAEMSKDLEKSYDFIKKYKFIDPNTKEQGDWTNPKHFNLMMKTFVGPVADEDHKAYLRPETCQPIFSNFSYLHKVARKKIPFGIAQIGKAFRNEINPRNFTFRSREFTQMEMEFFCHNDEALEWYEFWKKQRLNFFYDKLNFSQEKLRIHNHEKLAHYAKAALDIEFAFPFGWGELEGIHHRDTWDMSRHEEFSKENLKYYDEQSKQFYTPTVIETSVGLDRLVLALLCHSYDEDEAKTKKEGQEKDIRVVLRLPQLVAPVQIAVVPLSKKLIPQAQQLYQLLGNKWRKEFDTTGNIGRCYRRQDEIGTPFCVTVDFETEKRKSVTVRFRDSMKQERIAIEDLESFFSSALSY